MKLAEKELADGVMVNVTGWGMVKVSSQRIGSLSVNVAENRWC